MHVILAGFGGGTPETATGEALQVLREAACVLGAPRLLEQLPIGTTENRISALHPQAVLQALLAQPKGPCLVLFSGDAGFYSGCQALIPLLKEAGFSYRVLPGISSVQLLAARLCRPWQDWTLVSAHGRDCDPVAALSGGKPVFFLTGGKNTPGSLCQALTRAGLGALPVTVGEQLATKQERMITGLARELAGQDFAPLSVLLCEAAPQPERRCPGLPDSAFLRGSVPMTKQEVRSAALGKLGVRPADILWDIGAGTGSVSVELALAAPQGQVYAVEYREEAGFLVEQNRALHRAWNLHLIHGKAPEALAGLPAPDGVFVGGTKGNLPQILDHVLEQNPQARICVAAIALETLQQAVLTLTAHQIPVQVSQISAARTKAAGGLHLMTANNPVFLITGNCHD